MVTKSEDTCSTVALSISLMTDRIFRQKSKYINQNELIEWNHFLCQVKTSCVTQLVINNYDIRYSLALSGVIKTKNRPNNLEI